MKMRMSFLFMSLACLMSVADGCSCHLKHPQEQACRADFVLVVRVRREMRPGADGLTGIRVKIKKILKMSSKSMEAFAKKFIYTIPDQCGVKFKRRTNYLVSGNILAGKPLVGACDFVRSWRHLTPKMKKGFKMLYYNGCKCPIVSCHWWGQCPKGGSFCPWETSKNEEDCQKLHGVCLRDASGSCRWFGGKFYRKCNRNQNSKSKKLKNEVIQSSYSGVIKNNIARQFP